MVAHESQIFFFNFLLLCVYLIFYSLLYCFIVLIILVLIISALFQFFTKENLINP